jgi:formate hydrogenlyase subunit 4
MAWQNRRFEGGLPEYFAVEDAWMKWGIGIQIVSLVLVIAAIALGGFATILGGLHPVHTTSP